MIHARKDYDHIQDDTGKIGEDEPVFLLRAKDAIAPYVLRQWALQLHFRGGDPLVVQHVHNWAAKMERWQAENGCKLPDAPSGQLRDPTGEL